MKTIGLAYTELSPAAKEVAIKSFIAFYVHQYQQKSLGILGAKVSNQLLSTINEILRTNDFLDPDELAAVSYRLNKPAYQQILTQLTETKYQVNGEPLVDWQTAWQVQEEQLPHED